MDIILRGRHKGKDIAKDLASVLALFKKQYHIDQFCDIHINVTLLDREGEEVELVDTETAEVYRTFEVYPIGQSPESKKNAHPWIHLVVDNTHLG